MKTKLITALVGVLVALTSTSQADQIVIYKHTASHPWVHYTCLRPLSVDPASPAVPLTTLSGKYTVTEWWIYNATTSKLRRVAYGSQYVEGGKPEKFYSVGAEETLGTAAVNAGAASDTFLEMFVKTPKAGIFKHALMQAEDYFDDTVDLDNDGNNDSELLTQRLTLSGDAKSLTVAPGLIFPKVATKLVGTWRFGSDVSLLDASSAPLSRRQLFETGAPTLTLDLSRTKLANTGTAATPYYGGAAFTNGTFEYAIVILENELYNLDYDRR